MNRERNGKLLTLRDLGANSALAQRVKTKQFRDVRPDGGVVTQRTANPLPRAYFRDSSHNSPSVPRIAFQGLMRSGANSAQGIEAGTDKTTKIGLAVGESPVRQDTSSPTVPGSSQVHGRVCDPDYTGVGKARFVMTIDNGVSPTGSGYSAEPEPSSTVSAVPVSIPNARETALNWIDEYEREMLAERKAQYGTKFSADQQAAIEQSHRQLRAGVNIMADAIAMEARQGGDLGLHPKDDSAVRSNRPNPVEERGL